MDLTVFPQPLIKPDNLLGLYPTDFLVESIIDEGIEWFRKTADAPQQVFGRLLMDQVKNRYGEKKIDEIAIYLRSVEIRVIQAFPNESTQMPVISVNLGDSSEPEKYEGMGHHARSIDTLGSQGEVVRREEIGYLPVQDSILIGIHAVGTPDKVKYLYYLVAYILAAQGHDKLEAMGFFNIETRATDMSRFNELLPASVFTRFLTLNVTSMPKFKKGSVPMVDSFNINVNT